MSDSSAVLTAPPLSLNINGARNRRRWDRACDICRRRKSRCEIQDDATKCTLCDTHDYQCTFVKSSEPRKKRSSNAGEEDPPTKKRSPEFEIRTPKLSIDSATFECSPTTTQEPDDYAKLEGPSLLKETLGLQNHRHSRYIGTSDEFEPVYLDLVPFHNDEYQLPHGTLRRVGSHDIFLLLPDTATQNYADEPQDLDAIQLIVEPHGAALITLFFRIVHPSYPILHKDVFLEKYARSYREFSPPLLAAVYTLALRWWDYSQDLAFLPKPDAAALQKLALKSLDDVITRPKLSTVQAGLLLSQFLPGDLVPLTARLVAISQTLGLHRDCSAWHIPEWERGLRRRLAWALFVQDKWVALTHGWPCLIPAAKWQASPLLHEDFPESAKDENDEEGSAEVEKGRMSFSQIVALTQILAEILESPYDADITLNDGEDRMALARSMLEWAKPVQKKLKDWFTGLPDGLRMDDMKVRKLSSTGYLYLAYLTTEITLHRRIIRWLNVCRVGGEIQQVCRTAAKSRFMFALNFVDGLRPIHLQSFWYFSSKMNLTLIGTFGVLLWATASQNSETEFYRNKLKEYKWSLRVNSKVADFMEAALGRLEACTAALGD